MVREQRYLTISGIICWKKQICNGLKGPDSRTNKNHECSLGSTTFSLSRSCLILKRKNHAPLLQPFHSSSAEGLDEATLQNSLCKWQTQSKLVASLFYTRSRKWPPAKEVKWPHLKSREIKVLYLNICLPHKSLHWPVEEQIYSREAIWIKIYGISILALSRLCL